MYLFVSSASKGLLFFLVCSHHFGLRKEELVWELKMSSSADQKNPQSALPPPKHVAHLESSDHCTTLPTNLHMPAEWEPHRCCLILYPHNRQTFRLDKAQAQFDLVIRAIAEEGQEAVRILCQSQEQADELIKSKSSYKSKNYNSLIFCSLNFLSTPCPPQILEEWKVKFHFWANLF